MTYISVTASSPPHAERVASVIRILRWNPNYFRLSRFGPSEMSVNHHCLPAQTAELSTAWSGSLQIRRSLIARSSAEAAVRHCKAVKKQLLS